MIQTTIRKTGLALNWNQRLFFILRNVATAPYQSYLNKSIFDPERFTFPPQDKVKWDALTKEYTRKLFTKDVSAVFNHLVDLEKYYNGSVDNKQQRQMQMLNFFQAGLYLYMAMGSRYNVKEVNDIIQSYAKLIQQVKFFEVGNDALQPHIDTILKARLHAYHLERESRKSQIFALPIKNGFKQAVDDFHVDLSLFSRRLTDAHLIKCVEELNPETKETEHSTRHTTEPKISSQIPIGSYLDDFGNLHFEKACEYIENNKFEWKGEPITCRIYEFYESLPNDEKSTFLLDYLTFNKTKQSILEQYTHKLIKSPSKYSTVSEQSAKFVSHEQEMVKNWIDSSCRRIELISIGSPASDNEKVLYRFRQFVQVFPISTMISNIIYQLISSAYKEKVGVVEILNSMRIAFRRDISLMKNSDIKAQLFKFISDNDFDKFSSILVKSVIDSCILPKEYAISGADDEDDNTSVFTFNDTDSQFAFSLDTSYLSPAKSKSVIKINTVLTQSLTSIPIGSDSHHFPLLCPPEPWLGVNKGAYLERSTPFLSGFDQLQQTILQNAHLQGKLDSAFKCLDQMGKTAWSINPDLLLVFNKVMEIPQGFLDIPPKVIEVSSKSKQEIIDIKGLRLNFETVKMLANAFGRNGDMLYHCYVFDFRGRVYPLSPLTHYGGDLTRSLFQFWHGQPLGANGFYWIKYQLMSVFGGGTDCEQFFNQNRVDIIDSAVDPLHNRWWMKADEPFSALSVCIEIRKILQFLEQGKGSIEEYVCRLPIHQDGSCNGLQHYAALAADDLGGKAVNLVPMDTKQDVYSTVRDIVECKIIDDVENKLLEKDRDHAEFMLKILDRKLIKRPVMTTVYGVTLAGASRQILENIEKIVSDHDENPSKRGLYDDSTIDKLRQFNLKSTIYLARKILSSIDDLFYNAKQMERWLVDNTRRILTSHNVKTLNYLQLKTFASASLTSTSATKALSNWYKTPISYTPISWISASGFPVIQTYRKKLQPHSVTGALGSIMQRALSKYAPMDRRKHELAIAPNFIHSLDASHMFMTCDACAGKSENTSVDGPTGLTFASIHDSYWTHPNEVEKLSQILRRTFVKLHSFDYMNHVRNDFINQVKHSHLFQLVYFNKMKCPDLYTKLKTIRNEYEECDGKMKVSDVLNHELKQIHDLRQNHPVSQLLSEHDPKLYHIVGNNIYEYGYDVKGSGRALVDKSQRKQMVPVFVPVQILNLPKRGALDIRQVLQSKYFFS